jgi:heptosyltransferase-2
LLICAAILLFASLVPAKYLVIRFSSIGDIVLTTPILRSLRRGAPSAEIHYLTKPAFAPLLAENPNIDRLHTLPASWHQLRSQLRGEQFTYILDLHKNLRSLRTRWLLRSTPAASFPKLTLQKLLSARHIVERYAEVLRPLGIPLDDGGLDCYLPASARELARDWCRRKLGTVAPWGIVLGGTYPTKQWPLAYFQTLLDSWQAPVVLLGGPEDQPAADALAARLQVPCLNAAGRSDLNVSAALLEQCSAVLAHDTGLMHIAAALGKPVYALWGNTAPELGMTPYKTPHLNLENTGLYCHPCSRLGHERCPEGHFRCMRALTPEYVAEQIRQAALQHEA